MPTEVLRTRDIKKNNYNWLIVLMITKLLKFQPETNKLRLPKLRNLPL